MITLSLEIDATGIERSVSTLKTSLSSFAPEMKIIRAKQAVFVDLTFRQSGRSVRWKDLAGVTIAERRRKVREGARLIAGITTPLRAFHDSIRYSLIDLINQAEGSASYTNDTEAVTGTNLPYADKQNKARPFLTIPATDADAYGNVLVGGIVRRVVVAQKAI